MYTSCLSQNQSETAKTLGYTFSFFTYVNIYESVIFLYYRKGNGQNYLKSLFLNAFINVEIRFFTNWLQIFIKADKMWHFSFYRQ